VERKEKRSIYLKKKERERKKRITTGLLEKKRNFGSEGGKRGTHFLKKKNGQPPHISV